jgi:hypothetical protein
LSVIISVTKQKADKNVIFITFFHAPVFSHRRLTAYMTCAAVPPSHSPASALTAESVRANPPQVVLIQVIVA